MSPRPLTVAWFSFFPVEWLSEVPEVVRRVPRDHPASWQQVLLAELEQVPGLKLHIVALRKTYPRRFSFERHGVHFHLRRTIGRLRAPSLFWLDTWLIWNVLRRIRPDVVHAWGVEYGAAAVAPRLKYPYVLTMQGLLTWLRSQSPLNAYHRLIAMMEPWTVPQAPLVTTESSFGMEYLARQYPGLNLRQVEHAPRWLFHRLPRRPQSAPFRFLFIGAFGPPKGADVLVQALDQLRPDVPFELVAVGEPAADTLAALKGVTSPELWQRVQFRSHLAPEQVAEEMSQATLLIHPTRADTSPNSVKEAVAGAVPVVASRVGGIPDYVFHDKNGLLCEPGSVADLAKALRTACQHPLFSRGLVDAVTLARVREYLSPTTMGRKFSEIYRELQRSPEAAAAGS
jgi:glycosyltransferase involved in cell wall biosynthesis